jgi:hypothetical protein
MQKFNGDLVFLKGSKRFTEKIYLYVGDTIVFKYHNEGFKFNLFGKTTSAMRCSSVAAMVLDQQHGI